jgi:hypothetical protein
LGVENFFYWSKEQLRRPVVSVVHASLATAEPEQVPGPLIVLSHLYDSHYCRAYVEFLEVIPAGDGARGFYLTRTVRARIDPPHWFRALLLGRIKREMRSALARDLERLRLRLGRHAACSRVAPPRGPSSRLARAAGSAPRMP